MKKVNRIAWIVLASLSLIVGTWVWIDEGSEHSKFFVFYIFAIVCFSLLFLKRKAGRKNAKPKKRR